MTGPCLCGDPECGRCFPQPYYGLDEPAEHVCADCAVQNDLGEWFCDQCGNGLPKPVKSLDQLKLACLQAEIARLKDWP